MKNSLKHFIYLDRNRLESYSSQLLNGITQTRQFLKKNSNITSESSPDIEQTKSKEIEKDREVHLGAKNTLGGIVAKNGNKTITSYLISIEKKELTLQIALKLLFLKV